MTAFKRMPRLPGPKEPPKPKVRAAPQLAMTDVRSPLEVRFTQTLDDEKLAKRLVKLQAQFPAATLPELVVYNWLEREHVAFEYQVELFGGRRLRGGLLPDFVIQHGANAIAIQVQGEYWHSKALKDDRDRAVNLRMLGQIVNGRRIEHVVEVWENDLYQKNLRNTVMNLAIGGSGFRV